MAKKATLNRNLTVGAVSLPVGAIALYNYQFYDADRDTTWVCVTFTGEWRQVGTRVLDIQYFDIEPNVEQASEDTDALKARIADLEAENARLRRNMAEMIETRRRAAAFFKFLEDEEGKGTE